MSEQVKVNNKPKKDYRENNTYCTQYNRVLNFPICCNLHTFRFRLGFRVKK